MFNGSDWRGVVVLAGLGRNSGKNDETHSCASQTLGNYADEPEEEPRNICSLIYAADCETSDMTDPAPTKLGKMMHPAAAALFPEFGVVLIGPRGNYIFKIKRHICR